MPIGRTISEPVLYPSAKGIIKETEELAATVKFCVNVPSGIDIVPVVASSAVINTFKVGVKFSLKPNQKSVPLVESCACADNAACNAIIKVNIADLIIKSIFFFIVGTLQMLKKVNREIAD